MPDSIFPPDLWQTLLSAAIPTASGWLGSLADAMTDPAVKDVIRRQGQYANKAGDYVDLGGKGLGVLGIVTAQPEIAAAGGGGILAGKIFHTLGNAAIIGSDFLAGQRNQMLKDYAGAYVNSKAPPTADAQPVINQTGNYFGF